MIGVVVVFEQNSEASAPLAPDRELLGAPLLARAIAASIPAEQEAQVIVAVDPERVDDVQSDIVRRFGLIEVIAVLPYEGRLDELLRAALKSLGEGVELLLLTEGQRPLLPHVVLERVIGAALEHGAAVPTASAASPVMQLGDGALSPLDGPAVLIQGPIAVQRELLTQHMNSLANKDGLLRTLLASGLDLHPVEGDVDNILVADETDLSRAIEVWSRRAVDYAFLWPRPDRFEQTESEQNSDDGSASASIDAMLASGGENDERSGPFDEAIASLHSADDGASGDDTDDESRPGSEDNSEPHEDNKSSTELEADSDVNDTEFDDDEKTSPGREVS